MLDPLSVRRMVENEVVFRRLNENVQEGFDEIEKMAKEDGQQALIPEDDVQLQFYCECSDENCRLRIRLKPTRYNQLHVKRDRFVIIPGHETSSIEKIVIKTKQYYVVEKFTTPPRTASKLNPTDVDNV